MNHVVFDVYLFELVGMGHSLKMSNAAEDSATRMVETVLPVALEILRDV